MISLLLKLLIAHTLGDFVLQPDEWVVDKRLKKHRSRFLYLHVLVHVLTLLVLLQFDWNYVPLMVVIAVSHFFIDLVKLHLDSVVNTRLLFVIDQVAHLLIIGALVYFHEPFAIDFGVLYANSSLLLIFALLSITSISSIVMRLIMSRWTLNEDSENDSLAQAGKYIGILERLFVFGFIVLNQWQAIGLLIAAKSVFRFSDLSKAKDRKLTEYILIGTLLSFGLAISIGLAYRYAHQSWC
ncbi:hypothetical protein BFP72_05275 [Reichenbachiella sp. 5M10]|uniref:DUF3307 domain-containing protein n=1 Tax=Reichenbachiella sp. 5M10 TaxID=1889772 RepID=UPI000C160BE4|nr:DUF3307 domain-containing protein [Reichenbachiella sp. 5M10]PIB34856.1 hypothetical protein BFP72_05275 [Reichenbachiella sp. 5M10]